MEPRTRISRKLELVVCAVLLQNFYLSAGTEPESRVPLTKGLVFTTTSHAGLATNNGAMAIADTASFDLVRQKGRRY